ncbi:hypothetical protein B0A48_02187 [Cryoendolithus antarcticus]|uniref:Uncharacterized protein n=1 Tax=Cryoendolithus antarcticus TaxID=1507870 RepID=A0A1V8TMX6_9PEZI|nr:hypothetical protein B0A48_02187 [Cryoendolithus antarcticus]
MITIELPDGREIGLHGLTDTMNLAYVHSNMIAGIITPASMDYLRSVTKTAAKIIYNQEKFTEEYHSRVCGSRSALAWVLCATHRCSAPQEMTRDTFSFDSEGVDFSGLSSTQSFSEDATRSSNYQSSAVTDANAASPSPISPTCKSSTPGKSCQLPTLKNADMLPASCWDALYYAVAAEIKFLYQDLRERFGYKWERGTYVLHSFGTGEGVRYDVCVVELASMLERFWNDLMHPSVVAAIDYCVKRKNAFKQHGGVADMTEVLAADGMISVDGATAGQIWYMLEVDFVPAITQALNTDVGDDTHLMSPRSAMRRYGPAIRYGLDADYLHCSCPDGSYGHLSHAQKDAAASFADTTAPAARYTARCFAADLAGTVRARRAAFETPNLQLAIPAPAQVGAVTRGNSSGIAEGYRQLALGHPAATEEYNTQAVPTRKPLPYTQQAGRPRVAEPKTPVRVPKDANPLGFFGDNSGQRYPPEATFRAPPIVSPPAYGAMLQPIAVSASKRITPAEPSPDNSGLFPQPLIVKRNNAPTPSSRIPFMGEEVPQPRSGKDLSKKGYETAATLRALEGMEITKKTSKSATPATQSFPVPTRGNIREPDSLFSTPPPQQTFTTLSDPRYGSATDNEPFPRLSSDRTSPDPSRPFTTVLPSLISNPELRAHAQSAASNADLTSTTPHRDNITPRPATVQRYVSAGGLTPLHEREEITPPDLDFMRHPPSGLGSYSKEALIKAAEQLYAKEEAEKETRVKSQESVRSTGVSDGENVREGRERGSTGTGKVGERFKRMFSRTFSGSGNE